MDQRHARSPTITIKLPLKKILRHADQYSMIVHNVNRITTAGYLLARYIFLNCYERDPAFNVTPYINAAFFAECLRLLQIRRRMSVGQTTREYRSLIYRNLHSFCLLYHFRIQQVSGSQSNWEAYIGNEMATAYLNWFEIFVSCRLR